MQPVKMTRAEYEAKYGAQSTTADTPIKMTKAQYDVKYGSKPAEQSFADRLFFNKPTQGVPKENDGSVGSFVSNMGKAAYKNIADPLTARMNKVSDRALATGQSNASNAFQSVGALAGTALDVSLNKGIDMAIEGVNAAQDYAKKFSDYIPESIANINNPLPTAAPTVEEPSRIGKALGKALTYATETFPTQYPTATGNIEAGLNIAGVLPGSGAVRTATNKVASTLPKAKNALTAVSTKAGEIVKPIGEINPYGIKSQEVLTSAIDKEIRNIYKGATGDAMKLEESAMKAKKGLELLVKESPNLQVVDMSKPIGSKAVKPFDLAKGEPNDVINAVNNLSDNIAKIAKQSADDAAKQGLVIDTTAAQKVIVDAYNSGKLTKPSADRLLLQLKSTGGSPSKVHDWIQDQVNIKYFTKAGNLEDSITAKYANEAADGLRANLDKIVDRVGYAEAYGNNQELKRMLVTIAKKANKQVNFGNISTDAGLDAAISIITGNPEYMARTVASGIFRGIFSNIRNQSGFKSLKRAGANIAKSTTSARLPMQGTKVPVKPTLALPKPKSGAPQSQVASGPVINVPKGGFTARNMGTDELVGAKITRSNTPPNEIQVIRALPDDLKGVNAAKDFDSLSTKEKKTIENWLNKQPNEYVEAKKAEIAGMMDAIKGTIAMTEDANEGLLKLNKYVSKAGQYKGEFRYEDGSKGKFAKKYDSILSEATNQYATGNKMSEDEIIEKYFSVKKSIEDQKAMLEGLKSEQKKLSINQPRKIKLPATPQTTANANVSGEGKTANIKSNIPKTIQKSFDVIKPSIPYEGKLSSGALGEVRKDIAKYTNTNLAYVEEYTKNMGQKEMVKLANDLSDMPIDKRMGIVDKIVKSKILPKGK